MSPERAEEYSRRRSDGSGTVREDKAGHDFDFKSESRPLVLPRLPLLIPRPGSSLTKSFPRRPNQVCRRLKSENSFYAKYSTAFHPNYFTPTVD